MRSRLFIAAIAFGAILATATNGLLFLHLWACHHPACDKKHDPDPTPHSHNNHTCPICQVLLIHSGKYTLNRPPASSPAGLIVYSCLFPCLEQDSQISCFVCPARSPPRA